ncbi:hypothetical protein FRC10_007384 [Ceratobasidium sp. 414]|nr:hypothetical protein FRC10_007384 [Ceratobasidium sp. 414]
MADAGNRGFLRRAHIVLLYLATGKTLNLNLTTSDGVRLGAWFVAADEFYQQHLKPSPPTKAGRAHVSDGQSGVRSGGSNSSPGHPIVYHPRDKLASVLRVALQTRPTILYFHGNTYTRALEFRARFYSTLSSRLDANVFVIDYRGFGDSEGTPSENGLLLDARAAWDWLIKNGAEGRDITIVGQSLGTGVSAGLVVELEREGTSPRGMVLLAPYSSIPKLLETYNLLGKIPILQPLQRFRFAFDLMTKFLRHRFNTLSIINGISCPITIIHAADDQDIPISHARALFDSLLEPLLPADPFGPDDILLGKVPHLEIWKSTEERNTRRRELIAATEVEGFGTIRRFERGGDRGSVVLLETTWGGHNGIREIEGAVDIVGWTVGMIEPVINSALILNHR